MDGQLNSLIHRLQPGRRLMRALKVSLFLFVVALLALAVPFARWLVNDWGAGFVLIGLGIFETEPALDYMVGWLYAFIILFSIFFWPVSSKHKGVLIKLWMIRCLITLGVMLVYEGYYALDAYGYYHEARFQEYRWPVSFKDNWSLLSYSAWWINHTIMIEDSYHALKVIFSLLGLLGSYFLYLGIKAHTHKEDLRLMFALQVIPSMLFWSSILGKDPVNFCAICLYAYGVLSYLAGYNRAFSVLKIALGIGLAYVIRPWTAQILLLPLAILVIMKLPFRPVRWAAFLALPVLGKSVAASFLAQVGVSSANDFVMATQAVSRSWSRGGSALEAPNFNSVGDIFSFAPLGMFTALFRPLPGEIMNPFGLLAGLENAALLWLVVFGMKKKWDNWHHTPRGERTLLIWALLTILSWSFVYGFISYQNLGAAFRFRLQILPIMVLFVLFLNRKEESLRYSIRKADLVMDGHSDEEADDVIDQTPDTDQDEIDLGLAFPSR